MRRLVAVGAVAVAAGVLWTTSRDAPPASPPAPSAKRVVGYVNHQRSIRGLPGLKRSPVLSRRAAEWSSRLSAARSLAHASLTPGAAFSWLAECLYRGPGGPVRAWLRSPPHRAILMSGRAGLIGVGRTGDVWVGRFGRAR